MPGAEGGKKGELFGGETAVWEGKKVLGTDGGGGCTTV